MHYIEDFYQIILSNSNKTEAEKILFELEKEREHIFEMVQTEKRMGVQMRIFPPFCEQLLIVDNQIELTKKYLQNLA